MSKHVTVIHHPRNLRLCVCPTTSESALLRTLALGLGLEEQKIWALQDTHGFSVPVDYGSLKDGGIYLVPIDYGSLLSDTDDCLRRLTGDVDDMGALVPASDGAAPDDLSAAPAPSDEEQPEPPLRRRRTSAGSSIAVLPGGPDESEAHRFWRLRKIIFYMLKERGYWVAEGNLQETKEEFEGKWNEAVAEGGNRERFIILVHKFRYPDQQLLVFFPADSSKRVGPSPFRILEEQMVPKGIQEGIVVVKGCLTTQAKAFVSQAAVRLTVLREKDLIRTLDW